MAAVVWGSLLAGAVVGSTIAELLDLGAWCSTRLIKHAARRMPTDELRERYEMEWLAELASLDGLRLIKLFKAISIWVNAERVRRLWSESKRVTEYLFTFNQIWHRSLRTRDGKIPGDTAHINEEASTLAEAAVVGFPYNNNGTRGVYWDQQRFERTRFSIVTLGLFYIAWIICVAGLHVVKYRSDDTKASSIVHSMVQCVREGPIWHPRGHRQSKTRHPLYEERRPE